MSDRKWWFDFGWFSIAFDLTVSSIFRLSCLARVLFVYLAFYLIYLAFICRKKNLIFNFKILDFLGLLFFIVSARFFYFLFRFGIALVVMAASGIFDMTSSLVICFLVRYLRVRYVELPFVILRVGVFALLFDEGSGD